MPDHFEMLKSVVLMGAICDLKDETFSRRFSKDEINFINHNRSARAIRTGQFFSICAPFVPEEAQSASVEHTPLLDLRLTEFADIDDGTRVILKDDRGWSSSFGMSRNRPQHVVTGREIATMATLVLEPDDNLLWCEEMLELLISSGHRVDPVSVHSAPFRIEFGERLQDKLGNLAADLRE